MSYQPITSPDRDHDDETDKCDDCPRTVSADGIDGVRYHAIEDVRRAEYRHNDIFVARCGQQIRRAAAETIVEDGEELPADLNGNTICYGCVSPRRDGR